MSSPRLRDLLARLAQRPPESWRTQLEAAFPDDAALRQQALLWLHANQHQVHHETDPPSLGEHGDQRYELAVRLATGATASVWQAFDRKLGRNVAIKVFHDGLSEAIEQVIAEAQAASDVISDHVVRVLDVHDDDDHPYIVMELVAEHDPHGGHIALGTSAAACAPTSIEEIARWVMHVARGVHDAHLRNVFHRDLKPHNVLITPISRRARVADFGLAISSASDHVARPAIALVKSGPGEPVSVRGTPEYMAPEQARGLPLALDPRSAADRAVLVGVDVWGVGALAYGLLAGRPPWLARERDAALAWEVAASGEAPPRLERTTRGERLPTRLRRIVDKAMELEPSRRYASAAALANELGEYLARRPTSLDRSRVLRLWLWCRRNPQLALTALVAVALTLLTLATHATVERLRDERDALDREVAAQQAEQDQLTTRVEQARRALAITQQKLATEQQNLAALEKSIEEDRAAYEELLAAKEKSLRTANKATRLLVEQLQAARQERRAADEARAAYERLSAQTRRDAERYAKERDRARKDRDTARTERDALQRELDDAERELAVTRGQLESTEQRLLRHDLRGPATTATTTSQTPPPDARASAE